MPSIFNIAIPFIGFECPIHALFHIYCPGCGATRSTLALLRGDFVSSLYYNPIVVVALFYALVMLGLLALQKTGSSSEENVRRARKFVTIAFFIAWIGYGIARDIALVAFGIDWIGDFL